MVRQHEEKTDEELMALHQSGDKDAFTTIYNRHKSDLCGFVAQTLTGPWAADVEDVVDVIFTELYESAERFEQGRRLVPYLYRIAQHCTTDYVRWYSSAKRDTRRNEPLPVMKRRSSGVYEDILPDARGPEKQAAAEATAYLLGQLPPEEAEVVKLIRIEGHTAASAAKALGITLNQAQWRYRQGWNRLRAIAQAALASEPCCGINGPKCGLARPCCEPALARIAESAGEEPWYRQIDADNAPV